MELYEGGCFPQLRHRVQAHPALGARTRILSAEYGLIMADRLVMPYDRVLTECRAAELRPRVTETLRLDVEMSGPPEAVLVAAEPIYQGLIIGALTAQNIRPCLHLVDDARDWAAFSAVLDTWGWS
ncbi:hypothetical protein SM611_31765 [Actinomadura sp. DLS-62]|uniref:DUF6884 domain-containing protein n=1 Tax=Actinomadura monticuli TaxID=3097367 RepID=A0ABV4QK11_9ACTN